MEYGNICIKMEKKRLCKKQNEENLNISGIITDTEYGSQKMGMFHDHEYR